MRASRLESIVLTAVVVAGCAGNVQDSQQPTATALPSSRPTATASATAAATPPRSPSAQPASTQPSAATPPPSASPMASAIPLVAGCGPSVTRCQDIPAGTYVTTGSFAFLPGLIVTLPGGWSSTEQDAGEFNLHRVSDPAGNSTLLFWRDLVAVDTHGDPAVGVGRTPQDLVAFLGHDPRLVTSTPENVTIGDGLNALSVVISAAPDGPIDDPQCPGEACANPLTDPVHWGGPFGVALNVTEDPVLTCPCSHNARLYFSTIGSPSDPHTFIVAVVAYSADPAAELASFQNDVQPILDSVRVPDVIVDN